LSTKRKEKAGAIALSFSVAFCAATASATPFAEAHPFALDDAGMTGFRVLTAEDGAFEPADLVVIEYSGSIASPMAQNLRAIWREIEASSRFRRVLLRLNSPGGSDLHGAEVIDVLSEMREHVALSTVVEQGEVCASMCIAVYIQGDTRYASPASAWMFHGASRAMSNIPSLSLTMGFFDLFRLRGIDEVFINYLFEEQYVTTPGAYWLSGKELAGRSNIITDLLPNWRPAKPNPGPPNIVPGGI
jgi:hypothetical protein